MLERWHKQRLDVAGDYFSALDRGAPPDPEHVEKSYTSNRNSNLRLVLSGGAPGMWASNHFEELQHCTGWNFVAAHAFALQFAGAKITAYRRRQKNGKREPLPDDPIEALEERLKRLASPRHKAIQTEHETQGSKERLPLDYEHALVRLMRKPNPDQSGAQFRYQIAQQLALTGGCIIWILRDKRTKYDQRGTPREMYVIPTGLAYPQPASVQYPYGWYRVLPMNAFGTQLDPDGFGPPGSMGNLLATGGEIDKRDTRAIGWPHPLYVTDWLSALSAGALQVDLAEEIDRSIVARFRNEGRPGIVFGWESLDIWAKVPDEEKDAFRSDLRARNNGTHNTGNDLFLPPGVTGQSFDANPREMDFTGSRPQARDGVLALHQTPATVAGLTEATSYAALFASLKQYVELKVQPNLDMVFEELSEEVCPSFGPGHSLEAFARSIDDPALFGQKQDRLQTRGLVTVDEARASEGLGPHPDKEYGKLPAGTTWQVWQQVKQQAEQAKQQQAQAQQQGAQGNAPGNADALAALLGGQQENGKPANADEKPKQATDTTTGTRQEFRDAPDGRSDAMGTKALTWFGKAWDGQPHSYCSTQVNLPDDIAAKVIEYGKTIDPSDLAEQGLEDEPHITVKYGLVDDDPEPLLRALRGFGPITATLGNVSIFEGGKHGDVLKIDVQSEDLHRLNALIRGKVATEDKYPDYVPHVTVAYLKPGTGQKYAGYAGLAGTQLNFDSVLFANRKRGKTAIPLAGELADGTKSFDILVGKAFDADKHRRASELWLLLQGKSEAAIIAAAQSFLNDYTAEFRAKIEALIASGQGISLADVEALIDQEKLAHDYQAVVLPVMIQAAVDGARFEWKQHAPAGADFDQAAKQAEEETRKKWLWLYWLGLAGNIRQHLIQTGVNLVEEARRAGGPLARRAAQQTIAPPSAKTLGITEATATTGVGQDVARAALKVLGVVVNKVWICRMDGHERRSHHDAHGQTVPYDGKFLVGGYQADAPCDPALPIWERANCRCHAISLRVQTQTAKEKTFDESKHPRGQPDNAGQFGSGGGHSSTEPNGKPDSSKPTAHKDTGEHRDNSAVDPEKAAKEYQKLGTKAPAFKTWFGDWEHDAANASKVIAPDGSPQETHGTARKVFHGTQQNFQAFDKNRANESAAVGAGFYFAENPEIADRFAKTVFGPRPGAGHVIEAYLNIRKPFDFDGEVPAKDIMGIAEKAAAHAGEFDRDQFADNLKKAGTFTGHAVWHALKAAGADNVNHVLAESGYDGVVHRSKDEYGTPAEPGQRAGYGRVWIAFEPHQIKSTSNRGTFDANEAHIGKTWEESKHPRDHGKFSSSAGGGSEHHETGAKDKPSLQDHLETIDSWLSHPDNRRIHPIKRTRIVQALQTTAQRMPPACLDGAMANLKLPTTMYNSLSHLTEAFDGDGVARKTGQLIAGLYELHDDGKGQLHLDYSQSGSESEAIETHAHEMFHALDGPNTYSGTPEWASAYKDEIQREEHLPEHQHPLSKYASTNAQEGFAEFGRLIVVDPKSAEEMFPKCWGFIKDKGLV